MPQSKPPLPQLHLPLLAAAAVPFELSADQEQQLRQALIELLLHAAAPLVSEGERHEMGTQR